MGFRLSALAAAFFGLVQLVSPASAETQNAAGQAVKFASNADSSDSGQTASETPNADKTAAEDSAAGASEVAKPPKPSFAVSDISARMERLPRARSEHEKVIRSAIAEFYAARANAPVWVSREGINDRGAAIITETSDADSWGLKSRVFDLPELSASGSGQSLDALADIEIAIARAALKYAYEARGGRVDPVELSYDIDVNRSLIEPAVLIQELAKAESPDAYLRDLHPKAPQFKLLQQALARLRNPVASDDKAERIDEEAYRKAARAAEDDGLPPPPRPNLVIRKAAEMSPAEQIERIVRNMEMWRWYPVDLGATHVIANIPEFHVRIFEDGKETFKERIIVGKVSNKTAVFSDEMDHIVFRPRWNVPASIKVKEFLPGLLNGRDPISGSGLRMELGSRAVNPRSVNWLKVDIRNVHVYQPSGPGNALGAMKFMFPNKHAIYMHDTPTKNLFNNATRTFSHGCVRTRNPMEFAVNLLRIGNGWDREQTVDAFRSSPENNEVELERKIPVHVAYFTAWADPNSGNVRYFKDVYEHEKHLSYALSGKTHLIVKTKPNVAADYQNIREAALKRRQQNFFDWSPWGDGPSYSGSSYYSSGGSSYGNSGYNSDPSWRKKVFNRTD